MLALHAAIGQEAAPSPRSVIWSFCPVECSSGSDLENQVFLIRCPLQCHAKLPRLVPLRRSSRLCLSTSAALKGGLHVLGVLLGSSGLNVVPTVRYIPNISPKFGGNQSGCCCWGMVRILPPETVFLESGSWRQGVGRITGPLGCWLGLWLESSSTAGLVWGWGFPVTVIAEAERPWGICSSNVSSVSGGGRVGGWNRPGPQLGFPSI